MECFVFNDNQGSELFWIDNKQILSGEMPVEKSGKRFEIRRERYGAFARTDNDKEVVVIDLTGENNNVVGRFDCHEPMVDFYAVVLNDGGDEIYRGLMTDESYSGFYVGGKHREASDPEMKACFIFGLFGHEHEDACHRIDRDETARHHHHFHRGGKQRFGEGAEETVDHVRFAMETDHDFRGMAFFGHVAYSADNIEVDPLYGIDFDIHSLADGRGGSEGHSSHCLTTTVRIGPHEKSCGFIGIAPVAHEHGHAHEFFGRDRVGHGYNLARIFAMSEFVVREVVFGELHSDALGGILGGDGGLMTPFSQIKSVQTHFPAVNTPEIHLFATSFTFINR